MKKNSGMTVPHSPSPSWSVTMTCAIAFSSGMLAPGRTGRWQSAWRASSVPKRDFRHNDPRAVAAVRKALGT